MSLLSLYPEYEFHPTTHIDHTYPERGHHLHHIPFPYLGQQVHRLLHDKDQDIHIPKADVRETVSGFYIDVEVPGLKDKADITIRWTSMRTLLLTTNIQRPGIPVDEQPVPTRSSDEQPAPAKEETNGTAAGTGQNGTTITATKLNKEQETKPEEIGDDSQVAPKVHLTVHGRAIGYFQRAFNFPVDVERDKTTANLDAGLLRLTVPKVWHERVEHKSVMIDSGW